MTLHLLKSILFTIAMVVPPWIIYRLWRYRRPHKKASIFHLYEEFPGILFTTYLAIIVALTILPVPFTGIHNSSYTRINLLPLLNTYQQFVDSLSHPDAARKIFALQNMIGNILLFIPMGIFLAWFQKNQSLLKIVVIAFSVSFSIELIQLLLRQLNTYRTVDVDDILLNTIGAMFGYWIYGSTFGRQRKKTGYVQKSILTDPSISNG